jgi:hypothetical protein
MFCLVAGVSSVAVGNELQTGSGILTEDKRQVQPFTSVSAEIPLDIYVTVGTDVSVTVYLDGNLCANIITKVENGDLRITSLPNWKTTTKGRVEITAPDLNSITITGMGDAYVHVLSERNLKVMHDGMGTVHLDGTTKEIELLNAGSGDILARDLVADKVEAESRGSGHTEVFARLQFDGVTFSSGDIDYYGRPEYRLEHASVDGEIRRR